ncbi:MAG: GldG family protein [Verrucomicrobiia bacterium]
MESTGEPALEMIAMSKESHPPSFSPGRRWKIALNVAISVLALGAILVMVNYLAARHSHQLQWSSDNRFRLSPVTREVLGLVTKPLKVIVFFDRTKPLYDYVADLIAQYKLECPNLNVEWVDYERSLGRARAVQVDYGLAPASEGDRIVFDYGGKRRVVYAKALSEFDYSAVLRGKEVRRTGFKGEQLFTSAIYDLIDSRPTRVYFTQGHREHDPAGEDGQAGYLKFTRVLQENQVSVAKLEPTALLDSDVPADCQLLVIANPVTPFAQKELETLQKYMNSAGRLLVLFSVDSLKENLGLERLLASWGVEVGRNFVYEAPQGKASDVRQLIVTQFGNHPISNPLARSRLLMIVPRSINPRAQGPQSADASKVTELATTSAEGAASQPGGRLERQGAPIPVMVAVEKGAIQGIAADRGAARMVVVGDSYFLANAAIDIEANRDFARNAVNWLLNRDVLVQGIGTKSVKEYRITMTASELTKVRWLFMAGFPGSVLFLGFLVWFRGRA